MSDQEFFFDEEDEVTKTPKRAAASAKGSKPAPKPTPKAAQASSPSVFSQDVSMTVAALMAAIALLIGVIIGIVIPTGGSSVAPVATTPATSTGADVAAPELTEDQLNTEELPAGHPDISGMSADTTEVPTSEEATPAE
ncbi:MAG: hypothetical protein JXE06_01810 [Coriobacteriia bacterium]|nr:hypothetical protein [Coriobacteriia bacterium]MBN2822448.1 hypothetical protein [Coriobacteriia bacterium]